MADWLGQLMANWPVWLLIPGLIVAGIVWVFWYIAPLGNSTSSHKYEWPEDRKKHLQKNVKNNLKLKKG